MVEVVSDRGRVGHSIFGGSGGDRENLKNKGRAYFGPITVSSVFLEDWLGTERNPTLLSRVEAPE